MKMHVDRFMIGFIGFVLLESVSPAPLNPPVLDDRSYDDLVAETLQRIPTHTPEWTNYRVGDPGFRLLDFFAIIDPPVLDDLLVEDHMRPFWSTLPLEGEEFRGQFAYTWLDAALTSAEGPGAMRSPTWLTDHGINPGWTFNELLAAARVPEPAGFMLLAGGVMLLVNQWHRRSRRRQERLTKWPGEGDGPRPPC